MLLRSGLRLRGERSRPVRGVRDGVAITIPTFGDGDALAVPATALRAAFWPPQAAHTH